MRDEGCLVVGRDDEARRVRGAMEEGRRAKELGESEVVVERCQWRRQGSRVRASNTGSWVHVLLFLVITEYRYA